MAQMPPLRTIANGQDVDATDPEYNFSTIETHLSADVINRDGTVAMQAPLSIPDGTLESHAATVGQVTAAVPIGTLVMWAGNAASVPPAWLVCDGSTIQASTYPELAAIIGTSYGGTAASPRLPDMRSRFPAGLGTSGWSDALGETGGDKDAIVPAHDHTNTVSSDTHFHTMPTHSHGNGSLAVDINHNHPAFTTDTTTDGKHNHIVTTRTVTNDGTNQVVVASPAVTTGEVAYTRPTTGSGGHSHSISVDVPALGVTSKNVTGSTASVDPGDTNTDQHSHNVTINSAGESPTNKNLPPYVTVNFIIKAES